jgi:hypothetical protein
MMKTSSGRWWNDPTGGETEVLGESRVSVPLCTPYSTSLRKPSGGGGNIWIQRGGSKKSPENAHRRASLCLLFTVYCLLFTNTLGPSQQGGKTGRSVRARGGEQEL